MFKQLLARFAAMPPVDIALRGLVCRHVSVLMYHAVVEDDSPYHSWMMVRAREFDKQIGYLKRHFEIVDIGRLTSFSGERSRKPKAIITFDDGLRNNLNIALPILQKHFATATVYVSTGAVASGRPFWWDQVIYAVEYNSPDHLDLTDLNLKIYSFELRNDHVALWESLRCLISDLILLPPAKRSIAVESILDRTGTDINHVDPVFLPLTVDEVREMSGSPLITIGSHTHCHNLLTQIPIEQAARSIEQAQTLLTEWTGQTPHHFSYPNGAFNQELADLVARMGLATATTTEHGAFSTDTDRFAIPRICVGGYDDLPTFKADLLGVYRVLTRIRGTIKRR